MTHSTTEPDDEEDVDYDAPIPHIRIACLDCGEPMHIAALMPMDDGSNALNVFVSPLAHVCFRQAHARSLNPTKGE